MTRDISRRRNVALVTSLVLLAMLAPRLVRACPFCPALVPTLCQQREAADVVLLAELVARENDAPTARVHRVLKGETTYSAGTSVVLPNEATASGGLVLLFGRQVAAADAKSEPRIDWTSQPVDETSYAYFVRAPGLRTPSVERLRYFGRYLEHANARIAADASMEFAHAPFGDVAQAAAAIHMSLVRAWLADERVPQERKGFYGLLLGLASEPADVAANRELLRQAIDDPADDLRSGFDGMLAGYLLLEGESALVLIEERFLANRDSRDGDVRHALAALRFYAEYGRAIPLTRLATSVEPLLERPEFASTAIVELARWQAWDALERIVPLYDAPGYPQPGTRRAVVGYLLAAPSAEAADALARLRTLHAAEVAEAEQHLSLFGGGR